MNKIRNSASTSPGESFFLHFSFRQKKSGNVPYLSQKLTIFGFFVKICLTGFDLYARILFQYFENLFIFLRRVAWDLLKNLSGKDDLANA